MYSLTFRVRLHAVNACHVYRLPIRVALFCRSTKTRAPIANPPNSAQRGGTSYHSPSYVRVRAVVWACDRRQTDGRDNYTFRVV